MNMLQQLVFGVVALLAVSCQPGPRQDDFPRYVAPPPVETNEVKYHYRYGIDDAASGVFTHKWEERFGAYVKGAYSFLEPDGRVRIVDYEVDGPKGFHAVIRTSLPGNSYLSFQQLSNSRRSHGNPPVNILTNNPVKPSSIETKSPPKKVIAKDLPPNFHSDKPDYFWGDLPHDHFDHHNGKGHSEHDRHSTNGHSGHEHGRQPTSNHFGHEHGRTSTNDYTAHSSTGSTSEHGRISNEVRTPSSNAPRGNTRTWRDASQSQPRDFMTPPNQNAHIMNYDRLKPGSITDVIYTG